MPKPLNLVVACSENRVIGREGQLPWDIPEDGSDAKVAASVDQALDIAQSLPGEIMICGGQRIYEETLERADRIILTLVHAEVLGDTYFPDWRHLNWRETDKRESSDANYRYTFSILNRVR